MHEKNFNKIIWTNKSTRRKLEKNINLKYVYSQAHCIEIQKTQTKNTVKSVYKEEIQEAHKYS